MGQNKSQQNISEDRLIYFVSNSHLRKREVKKIYTKFCRLTKTGVLTRAQFVTLYNNCYSYYDINLLAEHMFRVFAMKNSYSIDFDEFLQCLSVTTRGTLSEQIEWIFRLYDIDGDGQIVMSEIIEIMRAANINQTSSEILTIFKRMDKNNDGVLTFEEFSNESLNDLTFLRLIGMQNNDIKL